MFLKFEAAALHFFYLAHWAIPWLILILGMYTIVRFARGYLDKRPFTQAERGLFVIFRDLMKIQGATGITYFILRSLMAHSFTVHYILHAVTMFIAALILPLGARWKSEDDATRYLNHFYLLLASFFVMLLGLALIP